MLARLLAMTILALVLCSCSDQPNMDSSAGTGKGKLVFVVNGEQFSHQEFMSKDGWKIKFDNVYVHLEKVQGYILSKPFKQLDYKISDREKGVAVPGEHMIDLTKNQGLHTLAEISGVPAGFYNGITFCLTRAKTGENAGYSLVLKGSATRENKKIDFVLKFSDQMKYAGGSYVGDKPKGNLIKNGQAEIEMTFHLDHFFGDGSKKATEHLNRMAPGFDFFASQIKNAKGEVVYQNLSKAKGEQRKLYNVLCSLGHVGEGHCHAESMP